MIITVPLEDIIYHIVLGVCVLALIVLDVLPYWFYTLKEKWDKRREEKKQ